MIGVLGESVSFWRVHIDHLFSNLCRAVPLFFRHPQSRGFAARADTLLCCGIRLLQKAGTASNVIQERLLVLTAGERERESESSVNFSYWRLCFASSPAQEAESISFDQSQSSLSLLRHISFAICIIATWQCAPVKGARLCLGNYALSFFPLA